MKNFRSKQKKYLLKPVVVLVTIAIFVGCIATFLEAVFPVEESVSQISGTTSEYYVYTINPVGKINTEMEIEKLSLIKKDRENVVKVENGDKAKREPVDASDETEDTILEIYRKANEYLLAQIIFCEAGGTGDRNEMLYVGKVALNRMITDFHDFQDVNTLEEGLYQKGQYAQATKDKISAGVVPTEECLEAAHALLIGETVYYVGFDGETHVFGDNVYWQSLGDISGWAKVICQTKCGHQYGIPYSE